MPYGTIKIDTVTFTDAGVDKSVTFSGLVQNPTFSGNVTVTGTLLGVTVTGTTANFTSGNFTNISGGTHTITSGVFAAGSAASPSITFTGDLNTGIYSPGADQVAISTGGSGRLFVDASGNVGVGVSASAWGGSWKTIEFLNGHSFGSAGTQAAVGQNLFNNGSNWIYKTSAPASFYQLNAGEHIWYSAPSGTAGNSVSLLERLRITSAGLVGVGTSSPGYKLDVQGAAASAIVGAQVLNTDPSGYSNLILRNSGGTAQEYQLVVGGSTSASAKNFWLYDATAGAVRLHVSSAGNVGIGTTSPGQLLSVFGGNITTEGSNASHYVSSGKQGVTTTYLMTDASGGNIQVDGAWPIRFTTNSNERARIDSSGRLLVGTSTARANVFADLTTALTPAHQIETVVNSSWSTGLSIINNSSSGFAPVLTLGLSCANSVGSNTLVPNGNTLGRINFAGNDGTNFVCGARIAGETDGTTGSGDLPSRLVFSTTANGASSPTERMRISSTGKTNITAAAGVSEPAIAWENTVNSSGTFGSVSFLGSNCNNTSSYHYIANTGLSDKYYIYGNGTTGTPSDINLKKNIETTRDGYLEDLCRLRVVKYNWNEQTDDEPKELGVIAQELEQVFPGLVQQGPEREDGSSYKAVKTSVLPFMLLKALQEAVARIEILEAKVAVLESV